MSPSGMSSTPRSWKPTTSASTDFSSRETRDAAELGQADVETGGLDDESDDARHASERASARQIADARGEAITKHRSAPCWRYARSSAVSTRPSTMRSRPSMRQPPRAMRGSASQLASRVPVIGACCSGAGEREQREVHRVHANAHRLVDRELGERAAHEIGDDRRGRRATSRATIWRATITASAAMFSSSIAGASAPLRRARRQLRRQRRRVASDARLCVARSAFALAVGETARIAFVDQRARAPPPCSAARRAIRAAATRRREPNASLRPPSSLERPRTGAGTLTPPASARTAACPVAL